MDNNSENSENLENNENQPNETVEANSEIAANEIEQEEIPTPNLQFTPNTLKALNETGSWGNFLSILGFIAVGFTVLGGIFASTMMGAFMPQETGMKGFTWLFGVVYIIFAALYFFPIYYLYNFAFKVKKAIRENDQTIMDSAFTNLKSHYKYIGIFAIIFIALYILTFAGMALIGSMF